MGQLKREGTPIITDNLSDASSGIVLDALDAGMDIEALDDIVGSIMQPEAVKNVVMALSKGAAAADIATAVLYSKFTEGKINPDVMMMLVEPVMYLTMAIGEEANIKYNIEGNDLDEIDNEDTDEATEEKLKQFENIFTQINTEVVPENMLSQIKEKGPEIRSMLSKGEA